MYLRSIRSPAGGSHPSLRLISTRLCDAVKGWEAFSPTGYQVSITRASGAFFFGGSDHGTLPTAWWNLVDVFSPSLSVHYPPVMRRSIAGQWEAVTHLSDVGASYVESDLRRPQVRCRRLELRCFGRSTKHTKIPSHWLPIMGPLHEYECLLFWFPDSMHGNTRYDKPIPPSSEPRCACD